MKIFPGVVVGCDVVEDEFVKACRDGDRFCAQDGVVWVCMYLVPQSLAGNDGDLIADTLVGLEVEGELWVVALDDDLCGLLDGLVVATRSASCILWSRRLAKSHLSSDTTHDCGVVLCC